MSIAWISHRLWFDFSNQLYAENAAIRLKMINICGEGKQKQTLLLTQRTIEQYPANEYEYINNMHLFA